MKRDWGYATNKQSIRVISFCKRISRENNNEELI